MKKLFRAAAVAAAAALALTACGGGGAASDPSNVSPTGEIKPREISWLLSRPADGAVINIMKKLADDYAKEHPGFALNLITTPRTGPRTFKSLKPWPQPTSYRNCSIPMPPPPSPRNWPSKAKWWTPISS